MPEGPEEFRSFLFRGTTSSMGFGGPCVWGPLWPHVNGIPHGTPPRAYFGLFSGSSTPAGTPSLPSLRVANFGFGFMFSFS